MVLILQLGRLDLLKLLGQGGHDEAAAGMYTKLYN